MLPPPLPPPLSIRTVLLPHWPLMPMKLTHVVVVATAAASSTINEQHQKTASLVAIRTASSAFVDAVADVKLPM